MAVFQDKLWILGGSNKNDVLWSTDGAEWNVAVTNAAWTGRAGHTTVVFDERLWVIGGWDGAYRNDVWFSSNGVDWQAATTAAGWTPRTTHATVVFNNKLWVIGGAGGSGVLDDVWSSEDGIHWTLVTDVPGWLPRRGLKTVVFQNSMWLMAGALQDDSRIGDVWVSPNGSEWTRVTAQAPWSARRGHEAVTWQDRIYVLGGEGTGRYLNDVWSSPNGVDWTCDTECAPWSPRRHHVALASDDGLWLVNGWNAVLLNDIWRFSPSGPEGQEEGQEEGWGGGSEDVTIALSTSDDQYIPGELLTVNVTVNSTCGEAITALGVVNFLPEGWAYDALVSAPSPVIQPHQGSTDSLEYAWADVPSFPFLISYTVLVPEDEVGGKIIGGLAYYRIDGPEQQSNFAVTMVNGTGSERHSADYAPSDWRFSLSELMRIIQFFNKGGFRCGTATEDGYSPSGGSDHSCTTHSSDYSPQDWQINLTELLRIIQFFNAGGYYACPDGVTEDGFCPVPH
jgi:hypothetical protein